MFLRRVTTIALALAATALTSVAAAAPASAAADHRLDKASCVRATYLSDLPAFESLVGRPVDCVLTYNDASPDWWGWETPWFTRPGANTNWANWVAAAPGRQLIISENLFPSALNNTDWRTPGAAGAFTDHAKTLATNLIRAGLGNSVIRLEWEANGDWYPGSIGNTPAEYAQWVQFWRKTVLAMKSVPGAHFVFDWCINAGYRAIDLNAYYPGDDVVDIVGIDGYDSGIPNMPAGAARWNVNYTRKSGIGEALAFSKAHGKQFSLPEWAVAPVTQGNSAGDDPTYVDGIAGIVRNNDVAYQSYFFARDFASQLQNGPGSLASYRKHFGANGDSVGAGVISDPNASPILPTAPTTPAATFVTNPVTAPRAVPLAPKTTPASVAPPRTPSAALTQNSEQAAKSLASTIASSVRKAQRRGARSAQLRVAPPVAGIACATVVKIAKGGAADLTCGNRHIHLREKGDASVQASASAARPGRRMTQIRIPSRKPTISVKLPATRSGHVTVVSAFIPASDSTVLSVTSRTVTLKG